MIDQNQLDRKTHYTPEEAVEQEIERMEEYTGVDITSREEGLRRVKQMHINQMMIQTEYERDGSIDDVHVDPVSEKDPLDIWKAIEYSETTQTFEVEFEQRD